MDAEPEPGTSRDRPALPLTIPLLLMLTACGLALWHRGGEPRPPPARLPRIASGAATDLASAIHRSPRAVVYIGCQVTTYSVVSREWFLTAAADIASEAGPDRVRFFVIEEETAENARKWAARFNDERLALFGSLGYGWVLWVESGKLRKVDPYAGYPGRSHRDIVEHGTEHKNRANFEREGGATWPIP